MFGTAIILTTLTLILLAVGGLAGGLSGMAVALVAACGINLASYWYSDRIVLGLYRAQPLNRPHIKEMVDKLARDAKLPVPRLYRIPQAVPNAFATGRSPQHAVIAVTDGLLELENEELKGVLAHELGHIDNNDMLVGTVAATIAGAISYIAQLGYWSMFSGGRKNEGSVIGLVLIVIFAPLAALLLRLALSRGREYTADRYAALVTRNPLGLASALKKISLAAEHHSLKGWSATSHLWIINPFREDWFTGLFSTHPPISKRIEVLEHMGRERKR